MTTPTTNQEPTTHPWRTTLGLAAGMILGFAALRWLPHLHRKSKIELIRDRAEALSERIAEFTEDAAEYTADALADLKS